MRKILVFLSVVSFLSGFSLFAFGAEKIKFPTRAIKVIVPQSPGGAIDMEPRAMLPYLSKILGVDMLIENVPGAGGKMGLTKCWKSPPDGYTILYHGIPQSIMNEYLFTTEVKTREFTHIFALLNTNMILFVHPESYRSMEELARAAREKALAGGVPSPGSTSHICGLVIADKLGMKVNWIPFNSASEVLTGVAGKHLDFGITSTNSAQPLAAAGKIRPLLVFSQGPDNVFPDVPYPGKLGYQISTMSAIRGFVAPPKTPSHIVKILSNAMFKTAKNPEFIEWAQKRKIEISPLNSAEYRAATEKQYVLLENYKRFFKLQ